MAKGKKSVFFCQNCGHEENKWLGQCPMCKEWNTFVEEPVSFSKSASAKQIKDAEVVALKHVETDQEERIKTKIEYFPYWKFSFSNLENTDFLI
mgnify:CR=1 FL=1